MASVLMVRAVRVQGRSGTQVLASIFYLEIIELDCDWLEEVVAALS